MQFGLKLWLFVGLALVIALANTAEADVNGCMHIEFSGEDWSEGFKEVQEACGNCCSGLRFFYGAILEETRKCGCF